MSSFIVNCKSETPNFWYRTDGLLYYFDNIKDYPLLSKNEERKLLESVKYGNKDESTKSMHKLVIHNQRFIASIVRRYSDGEDMLDLINEANIGLIEAIEKYDLNKDGRLITYAVHWIRKKINEYRVTKKGSIQKLNGYKISSYITKSKENFFKTNGRYPTDDELVEYVNEKYNANLSYKEDVFDMEIISLNDNSRYGEEDSYEMTDKGEIALCLSNNNTESKIENDYKSSLVEFMLKHLTYRQREIIKCYFGIGQEEMGFEAIAKHFEMSKERVRQIISESIDKLKSINIKDKTI